jgi:hypothetical protein
VKVLRTAGNRPRWVGQRWRIGIVTGGELGMGGGDNYMFGGCYAGGGVSRRNPRSRSELVTTKTELSAIAAAA